MIIARDIEPVLKRLARQYPVVTVTGPRQSGKTTLCQKAFSAKPYVNLEALDTRQFASDDPRAFLAQYPEGAILDEIQRTPGLLSYLQVIVDERRKNGMFILTGSRQFEVMSKVSQSLAGRTALLRLLPFSISEIDRAGWQAGADELMIRGFYPRIYDQKLDPSQAYRDYIDTYVERDLRQLVSIRDLANFQRFLRLCAGRIGQILNMQSLANDVGVSHTTIRSWISALEASYIVFLLQPYFGNISKRLIKSPKLYFYDVGLAACLLGISTAAQMSRDPLRGNLFENLAIAEMLKYRFNRGKQSNLFFYRDSTGNEVDVVYEIGRSLFPIEIKAGATVNEDFFRGLKSFAAVIKKLPYGAGVIYGGGKAEPRTAYKIAPIRQIQKLLDEVETAAGN
jgi:uncharacterized protein